MCVTRTLSNHTLYLSTARRNSCCISRWSNSKMCAMQQQWCFGEDIEMRYIWSNILVKMFLHEFMVCHISNLDLFKNLWKILVEHVSCMYMCNTNVLIRVYLVKCVLCVTRKTSKSNTIKVRSTKLSCIYDHNVISENSDKYSHILKMDITYHWPKVLVQYIYTKFCQSNHGLFTVV